MTEKGGQEPVVSGATIRRIPKGGIGSALISGQRCGDHIELTIACQGCGERWNVVFSVPYHGDAQSMALSCKCGNHRSVDDPTYTGPTCPAMTSWWDGEAEPGCMLPDGHTPENWHHDDILGWWER